MTKANNGMISPKIKTNAEIILLLPETFLVPKMNKTIVKIKKMKTNKGSSLSKSLMNFIFYIIVI
ncbi:hypothetical protein GCM10011343_27280 [Flavobacterium orientale]|uniref:Uncharacterized protein n=1 Tax=Flavobacterium orientale TaxID=1756020 RepID=A0A916Y9M6_9FLAO|nr:hypothetical protein GCM10011343_27280 [Flavobacterium orientale]